MSISDRLDEIEADIPMAERSPEMAQHFTADHGPELLAAVRAVLDVCSTYEKTQAIYGIEMGQREIIRVVRAEISAALGEES